MKNKIAIVFTGGLGPKKEQVIEKIEKADIFIAADSGWDLAVGMGVTPDYYIGDMDSICDREGLSKISENRVMKHPVDKDYTDTELAIKFLEDKNYRDIVLIGGGGGRIDHLMALLALFTRPYRPVEWFTSTERIIFIEEDRKINCFKGQTVSVFSNGNDAVISSVGLKWELNKFELGPDQFSISNTTLTDCVEIIILRGSVLFILNY